MVLYPSNAIGGGKTLLWQSNLATDAGRDAGDITVPDMSQYDAIAIDYRAAVSPSFSTENAFLDSFLGTQIASYKVRTLLKFTTLSDGMLCSFIRGVHYVNDTTLHIDIATRRKVDGTSDTTNAWLLPERIYGIKW